MKVTCKGKEFEQYECDEINALGIKTVENWRDAEIGDWIRTHDDKALQVTGRRFKTLKGKRKQITFVRTGFGETPTYYAKVYASSKKTGQVMTSFTNNMSGTSQRQYYRNNLQTISLNMENWTRTESLIQPQLSMLTQAPLATTTLNKLLEEVLEFYEKNTSLIGLA